MTTYRSAPVEVLGTHLGPSEADCARSRLTAVPPSRHLLLTVTQCDDVETGRHEVASRRPRAVLVLFGAQCARMLLPFRLGSARLGMPKMEACVYLSRRMRRSGCAEQQQQQQLSHQDQGRPTPPRWPGRTHNSPAPLRSRDAALFMAACVRACVRVIALQAITQRENGRIPSVHFSHIYMSLPHLMGDFLPPHRNIC